jgi:sugar/nucleoside kinase (ribokinase family)
MYDVTVIGPSVIDILAAPFDPEALARGKRDMDQIRMSFGGDALNEAVVLTRLGKKVQLLSKIGADQAGRSIRKHLEKAGVSTENLIIQEGLSTSVNIALVDAVGGRKFLMDPRSSQRKLGLEDILPFLDETADIVSFASIFISPCFTIAKMEELFAKLKAAGKTLIVDVTRPKNGETFDDLRVLFPYIDVIVPNDEEIYLLTGEKDPEKNVKMLVDAGVATAIVKIGDQGCLVGTRDGIVRVPAVKDVRCVDTTGAGDTFAAGLIAGLVDGRSMTDCARLGCAAASCSIEEFGATDGVRSLEQVMNRYHRIS